MVVVSVGSINVDRVAYVDADALAEFSGQAWFPAPGETRRVEEVPPAARAAATERFHGGKGANQAVAAAAAGAEAALLGRVGRDAADVREALAGRGVDAGGVEDADAPTGAAYVFVGPDGENHIAIVAGANGTVDSAYVRRHREAVARAGALLVQNEIPVPASVAALRIADESDGSEDEEAPDWRGPGPVAVCNPSPVDGAEALLEAGPDVAVVNAGEYDALEGALASVPVVVRTAGPAPVVVEGRAIERFEVTPPSVDPVDTTGAGDVFAGYLATRLARGATLSAAVDVATAAASLSTEREGVQQAVPPASAVEAFLDGRGQSGAR